jgi:hypothetical protein
LAAEPVRRRVYRWALGASALLVPFAATVGMGILAYHTIGNPWVSLENDSELNIEVVDLATNQVVLHNQPEENAANEVAELRPGTYLVRAYDRSGPNAGQQIYSEQFTLVPRQQRRIVIPGVSVLYLELVDPTAAVTVAAVRGARWEMTVDDTWHRLARNGRTVLIREVPKDLYRITAAKGGQEYHRSFVEVKGRTTTVYVPAPGTPATDKDGFIPLFNGKDLTGWETRPGDRGKWLVENGALVGASNQPSHLFTARGDYENFHLRVQFRAGNWRTGIGFRCPKELHFGGVFPMGYRMWVDPFEDGVSTLYSYPGEHLWQKSQKIAIPPDSWVTVEIIAQGSRLKTFVNGTKTGDVADTEFRRGHIAVTADEGVFRRIEIKELPPLSPEDDSWQSLLNGADLEGWTAAANDPRFWSVQDGILRGSGGKGLLFAHRREYSDFHLKAVARVNDGGDGGIYFRGDKAKLEMNQAHGYDARINATIQNVPRTGSLEDTLANYQMGKDPLVKPGEWFTYEIIAQGYRIQLKVNGQTTLEWTDGNRQRAGGHLALHVAGEKSVVEFKSIEIKELPASSNPQPVKLQSFTPGKDPLPLPLRGPAKAVTVDGDSWRIENANQGGNYNVMIAQDLRDLPKDGVLVFRAKVKVEAKDERSWGDLGFGAANHLFISWDGWPRARSRYDRNDANWVQKEERYPVADIKTNPPTVYLYAGLHADGVLWLKDVELLHLPAAKGARE